MKYRFFAIPVHASDAAQEELNRFCAKQRLVSVDKQFVQNAEQSYWAFCIGYLDGQEGSKAATKGKIDYREVLNEQDFALFSRLRTLRKELADGEGIPIYAVFTNEQLAALVQRRVQSAAALREIAGVGESRIEKYGDAFLRLLREVFVTVGPTPSESTGEA
ncbi:MAG: HRDC domain-containing protein [Candidatus Competibacteraceae bacterium]|nr:HRDC domain-containing protein [Candidatus Competibacteraceae bacterium]